MAGFHAVATYQITSLEEATASMNEKKLRLLMLGLTFALPVLVSLAFAGFQPNLPYQATYHSPAFGPNGGGHGIH